MERVYDSRFEGLSTMGLGSLCDLGICFCLGILGGFRAVLICITQMSLAGSNRR